MATEDISRDATSRRKRYAGVRLQQGRVSTDDDYNEGARIDAEETRRALIDVIGPSGSADGGFSISNPRINGHGDLDFTIGAGTLYLGGLRLECFGEDYTEQSDWLEQLPADRAAPVDGRTDLVYLMAWDQPVEAIEDSELFETALGGPDTATRVRPMQRVMLATGIAGADCATAWSNELATLTAAYGTFDPATGLCTPDSKLTVTFDKTGVTDDLCSPSVVGGYLGAENQAIRVQIVDSTHFAWGFDNASPLYRVTIGADRKTVTLQTEPKDQAHWMQSGQAVEILAWSAVLPNGEKLAEVSGFLTTVEGAYDPDQQTLTLTDLLPLMPAPLFGEQWQSRDDAAALDAPAPYYFMRVWPRGSDTTSAAALSFAPGNPQPLGTTGVLVTLTGTVFVPGDYWVIAARPEDPTRVVPWDLLYGRAPNGIRRCFTPLARIAWAVNLNDTTGTTVDDCRTPFQPLTRRQTCCTFTVGDGVRSHGDYTVIQDAIDHLPPQGGCICLLAGAFAQDLRIDGRTNIRIEGCGERSVIQGAAGSTNPAAVSIIDSSDITLTGLAITSLDRIPLQLVDRTEAAALNLPAALSVTPPPPNQPSGVRLSHIRLHALSIQARDICAAVIAGGSFVALLDSEIKVQPLAADLVAGAQTGRWPAIFAAADDVRLECNEITAEAPIFQIGEKFAAAPAPVGVGNAIITLRSRLALGGIQVAGGSERVSILRNRIAGGTGNGITLGSIAYVVQAALAAFVANGDFLAVAKGWNYTIAGGSLVVDNNGCIQYVPNPTPPNGPDGNLLVPISTGVLTDIRIENNEIADLGQSGIAVAMFFDMTTNAQAIEVDRLTIAANRITGCLQVELPEITGALAGWAAYGAIALGLSNELRIEANLVETNGQSHLQPICGVFVLTGSGLEITANTIRDNGPRVASASVAQAGLRGGIFIGVAYAPAEEIGTEARPAARIHDNLVVCQDGQALVIVGAIGAVSVSRNALTTRGASALTGAAATAFGQAGAAGGLATFYLNFGACVVILDLGVSSELVATGSFANTTFSYAEAGALILPRGVVLFNDNQVLLDVMTGREGFVVSSVFLISLDDVSVQHNQIALWAGADLFLTDLLALAGGLRIIGNRLSETLLRCLLSSLGLGLMATASLNQSTHCLVTFGLLGAPSQVTGNNVVLIDALAQALGLPSPCPGILTV
jgi:Right handed beta helix region/Family of unknown function (DUF6519)